MSLDSYEVTGPGFEEIDNMIILAEESSIQFRKKKDKQILNISVSFVFEQIMLWVLGLFTAPSRKLQSLPFDSA